MSQLDEAALYDAFDSAPDAIVAFLRHMAHGAGLGASVRVLDMGCGPGRLLPALAGIGWSVHGVEPDPAYREFARRRVLHAPHIAVTDGSFQTLELKVPFDLVIAINSVFNHLLGPVERADALSRSYRAIHPGGLLILDLANFPWILDHYVAPQPHTAELDGKVVSLIHRHEIDRVEHTFTTHQEYTLDGDAGGAVSFSKTHVYAMVEQTALVEEVRAAGFRDVRTFGNWASRTSEPAEGPRIILVAARPADAQTGARSPAAC
jgi:SAM-dependent methyltransferase